MAVIKLTAEANIMGNSTPSGESDPNPALKVIIDVGNTCIQVELATKSIV